MMAASAPPLARDLRKLLVIDPRRGAYDDARVPDLPGLLRAGDLLVVNDAATLPAALPARTDAGVAVEARLLRERDDGAWDAVLLGEGSPRARTEDRTPPPRLAPGARLTFGPELEAHVTWVSPSSARWVALRFRETDAALWSALFALGRPVQYSYVRVDLALWDVQTIYASRPWAVEAPSAGLPLTGEILLALRRRGVRVARVTHAAGLSSTGDAELDHALPLEERYSIPDATARAVGAVHAEGGRVVAGGTSVVRALEGAAAAHEGRLVAGEATTDLRIAEGFEPRVVSGLLTGIHEPTASHFDLLQAFTPGALLREAYAHAEARGYLGHELGDLNLILPA